MGCFSAAGHGRYASGHQEPRIHQELVEEFRRYAAVIADPQTPAVALEVVTNDARAAAFFESLLHSFGIPGEVLIRP